MFSGKSTTAKLLHDELGFVIVSGRQVLRDLAPSALGTRADLQRFGSELEFQTDGRWLGAAAAAAAKNASHAVVVDAARTQRQVDAVRAALGSAHHVHLTAPYTELQRRFDSQLKDLDEPASFERAMSHPVEQEALRLGIKADVILDSHALRPEALLKQITELLTEVP